MAPEGRRGLRLRPVTAGLDPVASRAGNANCRAAAICDARLSDQLVKIRRVAVERLRKMEVFRPRDCGCAANGRARA